MRPEIKHLAEQYCKVETNALFRKEVEMLLAEGNEDELNDRFYTELAFGTGGLRGLIGGGFNRINPFVIKRTTQGLANYIKQHSDEANLSVVIAHDSRNYADTFAQAAARVMAGNKIKCYLFSSLRPTPMLSFAVRRLRATAGIVITASHNPAEYNGYKVYWSDGAQIIPPHDKGIIDKVRDVAGSIKTMSQDDAKKAGLLEIADDKIDEAYYTIVENQVLRRDIFRTRGSDIKVVYTPLYGSGKVPIKTILERLGVHVNIVAEQEAPDGNFPTVALPNPEDPSVLKMALDLGRKVHADIVFGTDPDADRLGIAVPSKDDFVLITGNQLGALFVDYLFSTRKELGTLPRRAALVKTIVTTNLQKRIAESYGAKCFDVLTGFKYIAELIGKLESQNGPQYIFGGEESYGYLASTEVRDKDAVASAVLAVEMTLYNLSCGKGLLERLDELYLQHGYFEEILISETFKGQQGLIFIKSLMEKLRKESPQSIGGSKLLFVKDYIDGTTRDTKLGTVAKNIDLPSSDVLQFFLEDESIISARPSGTEPKIKFYASCNAPAKHNLDSAKKVVGEKLRRIEDTIADWLR
jgi:phosphoglucomutase